MESCKRKPVPSPTEDDDRDDGDDDPQTNQEFADFKVWLDSRNPQPVQPDAKPIQNVNRGPPSLDEPVPPVKCRICGWTDENGNCG